MHKLKNKHTGEVITTPYLAEAEEYLKSGDYEMEKPTLKIVQNNVTVYESDNLTLKVKGLFFVEHETNTLYCGETVERLFNHSDAVKSIEVQNEKPVYTKEMRERGEWPPVGSNVLLKYIDGIDSCASVPEWRDAIATILYLSDENLIVEIDGKERHFFECFKFKPLPTIEDELFDVTSRFIGREMTQADLVSDLLDRYNITPKEK